jgi:hypothetical protein
MTYGEIITEISRLVYGATTAPAFIGTRLHGTEGLLARKRKIIMDRNYWFMETVRRFALADGLAQYAPNISLKEEISLKLEDYATGDYHDPLTKLNLNNIDSSFSDIDGEEEYPTHYYMDYNDTLDLRRFTFKKTPSDTTYSTELSVGSTATRIANTAFKYQLNGTAYTGSANAAGSTFTTANTINTAAGAGTFWGAWSVEIDSSGNVYTYPAGGLSNQVYTSEAEAISNLPAPTYHPMGFVTIECNTGASWTANTDDLTEGSDCTSCNFYNATVVCELRYWKYYADLSSVDGTLDSTTDEISVHCKDLLAWMCVKDIVTIQHDWEMLQIAERNIAEHEAILRNRDFNYRMAGVQEVPYKAI